MKVGQLRIFLVLQIATVPIVILIFKFIEAKNVAGIVAGTLFISVGSYMVYKAIKWPGFYKSPVFYLTCIQLLLISLPLFFTRIANFNIPFDELTIIGLPGPTFHKLSEKVFGLLMITTVIEQTLLARSNKQKEAGTLKG